MTVAAVLCLLVAAFSILDLRRLDHLLDMDMRTDVEHIASALAATVSMIDEHEGRTRALEILANVDDHEPSMRIRWICKEHLSSRRRKHSPPQEGLRSPHLSRSLTSIVYGPKGKRSLSCEVLVLDPQHNVLGAIQVLKSYRQRERYLVVSLETSAATALALWVTALLAAIVLGRRWIVAPVLLLKKKMDRVARGDLSTPLILSNGDEFTELAEGLNSMCTSLENLETQRREVSSHLAHAERLLTLGRLAAGLAHELGTPLNVISGRARRIERRHKKGAECGPDAQIILDQAEKIAILTRKLLNFARRDDPSRVPTRISELLDRIETLLGAEAMRHGRTLTVACHPEIDTLNLDPRQFEQVLVNVVMNAIHASPTKGEVTLQAFPQDSEESGPGVLFHIQDLGAGIPDDILPHIFEPFFTTKPTGEGTGLGLSVVHGIVTDHEGTVQISSPPGKGTTVSIWIPKERS
jgi:signal transduction histidine kinase